MLKFVESGFYLSSFSVMSSAGKFARLSIRVHCLTGITSDALKRFNKNVVSISAEYLGITVESARTRIGGIVKVNDVR